MGYEKIKGDEGRGEYEWKRLEVDNLPPDILTGNYEFLHGSEICNHDEFPTFFLDRALQNSAVYYYRRKQKPMPSHKEIMTKWWKHLNGIWCKVQSYDPKNEDEKYYFGNSWVSAKYFRCLDSADIPPGGPVVA